MTAEQRNMNSRLLIDAIVRQTTVLIAQLSTAAGIRAPLAHVADEVFVSLAREIEGQDLARGSKAGAAPPALGRFRRRVSKCGGQPKRRGVPHERAMRAATCVWARDVHLRSRWFAHRRGYSVTEVGR
jgi:hypothetical protein